MSKVRKAISLFVGANKIVSRTNFTERRNVPKFQITFAKTTKGAINRTSTPEPVLEQC